jgi:hypothetical protein
MGSQISHHNKPNLSHFRQTVTRCWLFGEIVSSGIGLYCCERKIVPGSDGYWERNWVRMVPCLAGLADEAPEAPEAEAPDSSHGWDSYDGPSDWDDCCSGWPEPKRQNQNFILEDAVRMFSATYSPSGWLLGAIVGSGIGFGVYYRTKAFLNQVQPHCSYWLDPWYCGTTPWDPSGVLPKKPWWDRRRTDYEKQPQVLSPSGFACRSEAQCSRDREHWRIREILEDLWEQPLERGWDVVPDEERSLESVFPSASPAQIAEWAYQRWQHEFRFARNDEVEQNMDDFERRQSLALLREVALREKNIRGSCCVRRVRRHDSLVVPDLSDIEEEV